MFHNINNNFMHKDHLYFVVYVHIYIHTYMHTYRVFHFKTHKNIKLLYYTNYFLT